MHRIQSLLAWAGVGFALASLGCGETPAKPPTPAVKAAASEDDKPPAFPQSAHPALKNASEERTAALIEELLAGSTGSNRNRDRYLDLLKLSLTDLLYEPSQSGRRAGSRAGTGRAGPTP